jgi:hypothetical protein
MGLSEQTAETEQRRRIILHCGAPKTGSTSLQNYFADNADQLKADGVVYPPRFFRRSLVDPLHESFTRLRVGKRPEDSLMSEARARLDALFADGGVHTVLISNESILGEPYHADQRGFFPEHAAAIKQLGRLFEGYDVTVVYFIRDFEGFLPSYYVQYVRMGGYLTFDRFCAHVGRDNISWQPVLRALRKAFGEQNVFCWEAAAMRQAPVRVVQEAFGSLFPSLPEFDPTHYNRNQSVGQGVLAFYRAMNRLLDTSMSKRRRRKVRPLMRQYMFEPLAYISRFFSRGGKPEPVDPPPAKQVLRWRQQYAEDREALGFSQK